MIQNKVFILLLYLQPTKRKKYLSDNLNQDIPKKDTNNHGKSQQENNIEQHKGQSEDCQKLAMDQYNKEYHLASLKNLNPMLSYNPNIWAVPPPFLFEQPHSSNTPQFQNVVTGSNLPYNNLTNPNNVNASNFLGPSLNINLPNQPAYFMNSLPNLIGVNANNIYSKPIINTNNMLDPTNNQFGLTKQCVVMPNNMVSQPIIYPNSLAGQSIPNFVTRPNEMVEHPVIMKDHLIQTRNTKNHLNSNVIDSLQQFPKTNALEQNVIKRDSREEDENENNETSALDLLSNRFKVIQNPGNDASLRVVKSYKRNHESDYTMDQFTLRTKMTALDINDLRFKLTAKKKVHDTLEQKESDTSDKDSDEGLNLSNFYYYLIHYLSINIL